jgi:hypothetical protein
MGKPTSLGIKGGRDLIWRVNQLDQNQALQKVEELSVQFKGGGDCSLLKLKLYLDT